MRTAPGRFTSRLTAFAFAVASLAGGCDRSTREQQRSESSPAATAPGATTEEPSGRDRAREHYDLVDLLPECEAHAAGLLLDFGSEASEWRRGYSLGPFDDTPSGERKGATFARILSRRTAYDFWLDTPATELEVSARVHGVRAPDFTAFMDGKRVGVTKLIKDETRVVSAGVVRGDFAAGRHSLMLVFRGAVANGEAFAEVDWVRIGAPGPDIASYAAPTLRDVVANVVLDDKPRRAIALRAGTSVRCPLRVGPDAQLSVSLGYWGNGKGRAELSLLRDGETPVKLEERRVSGGDGATWSQAKIDLRAYASQVVSLELSAPEATPGGRIAFGDPMLESATAHSPTIPEAHTVVVVVFGSTDRKWIPPWGDASGLPAVAEFARSATAFSSYRVPTTVVSATIASALSGLGARAHTLERPSQRLPSRVLLLSEILKEAGGRGAMFTGVPTTSASFGFDSGWDTFDWVSPVADVPATEPLTRASAWLSKELAQQTPGRRLVVVHLRGAHPPWDLSKDEVRSLKPADYTGPFEDARRGGGTLVRYRESGRAGRLDDDDWMRLRALEHAALARQSEAVGGLLRALRDRQQLADTLFILMGDVGPGDGPMAPFDPAAELTADHLLVPLIIKFPGDSAVGREITETVTSVDIARTIADALRIRLPESARGEDLFEVAANRSPVVARALVATLGDRYATRYGAWTLTGQLGRVPRLCRLDVDPACENDVFSTSPIAAAASWQATVESLALEARTSAEFSKGEPALAAVSPDVANALIVWGDIR